MIVAEAYKGKTIGVFGLARSGIAVGNSLLAGGAKVLAWDDNASTRKQIKLPLADLYDLDFAKLDALVVAPGVPLTHPSPHPLVTKANETGVTVIGDMEVFAKCENTLPAHNLVAVTGTNGKSTTTSLLTHVLVASNKVATLGGNIGVPILSLKPLESGGTYVFELSSFQIDLMQSFKADIAIILNITPDHLDRHGNMKGYVQSKTRLFELQNPDQVAIVGVDDVYGMDLAYNLEQKVIPISVERELPVGVYVLGAKLYDAMDGEPKLIGSLAGCQALKGDHNGQNAAAVYAAGRLLGLGAEEILEAFESFPGLRHRLQVVGDKGGVLFVDDSKASNTGAAQKALLAYDHIHWIAGGKLKEDDLSALEPALDRVKHAYLVGEAADTLAKFLDGKVAVSKSETINEAVREASKKAVSGDVVLLAPACASFDQYPDFEARGRDFVSSVADVGANISINAKTRVNEGGAA